MSALESKQVEKLTIDDYIEGEKQTPVKHEFLMAMYMQWVAQVIDMDL